VRDFLIRHLRSEERALLTLRYVHGFSSEARSDHRALTRGRTPAPLACSKTAGRRPRFGVGFRAQRVRGGRVEPAASGVTGVSLPTAESRITDGIAPFARVAQTGRSCAYLCVVSS
jgi:hypothetical protein